MVTFSETPNWHHITGTTLKEKVTSLSAAEWGSSTNMRAALNLLLTDAKNANLSTEQMVDTLFIFTDMQFDSGVCANHSWDEQTNSQPTWESTFEEMKKTYEEAGYKFPNIICWNLRTSCAKTVPVSKNENGFVMLSGFSAELLKCILDAEEFSPLAMMKHILGPYKVPESITNCNINLAYMNDQELQQLSSAVSKSAIKKGCKNKVETDITENVAGMFDNITEWTLINLLQGPVIVEKVGDGSSVTSPIADETTEIITDKTMETVADEIIERITDETIEVRSCQTSDTDTSASDSSSESD